VALPAARGGLRFIITVFRRAPNMGQVAVVNGFLGWTFVG
jgi:hypothetical protein